jgi:hypothetical protein
VEARFGDIHCTMGNGIDGTGVASAAAGAGTFWGVFGICDTLALGPEDWVGDAVCAFVAGVASGAASQTAVCASKRGQSCSAGSYATAMTLGGATGLAGSLTGSALRLALTGTADSLIPGAYDDLNGASGDDPSSGSSSSGAGSGSTADNEIWQAKQKIGSEADHPTPSKSSSSAAHDPQPATQAKPVANDLPERETVTAAHPAPDDAVKAAVVKPAAADAAPIEAAPREALAPKAGDETAPSCSATHSFTGSTGVLMADGTVKPIGQVKVGDEIADSVPGQDVTLENTVTAVIVTHTDHDFVDLAIAAEPTNSAAKPSPVAAVSESARTKPTASASLAKKLAVGVAAAVVALAGTTAAAVHSDSNGGTLTTTYRHPFYDITQQSFVDAQYLKVGDQLQTTTGRAVVTDVRLFHADTTTYDLTIGALHTYYVVAGNTPVLVHNIDLPALNACPTSPTTHWANTDTFDASGTPVDSYPIRSGAQTPAEQAMGRGGETLSHTENRVARMSGGVPTYGGRVVNGDEFFGDSPVPEGGYVVIEGTRPPCSSCMGAMTRASEDTGATFAYFWEHPEEGTQWWQTNYPLGWPRK